MCEAWCQCHNPGTCCLGFYVTTLALGKLRLLGVSEPQPSHLHNSTVVGFLENFNEFLTCQVFGIIRGT